MESRGIVVSLTPMTNESVGRVSAYSTDALGRPLVIVTPERARSIYRYRFTCAHELGHLLLHASPLPGDRQQEREADEFAAEFLTPRAEIEPLLPRTMRIAELERLSADWGVSVESLVRRMGELRVVSDLSRCGARTSG
jgi:Zn-dependent peptidase ImmA (M78 family)